jgi:TonB family protein
MKKSLIASCVLLVASQATAQNASQIATQNGLTAARTLYASASYEEALMSLSSPDTGADPNQVDEYRALCYLALGQGTSAEQALERIVNRAPLYALNELDVSPKLVTLFQNVRQRVIPSVVRKLYSRAKGSFDAKAFPQAASEFRLVLAAVAETTEDAGLADIRQLADGFLKLSEAAIVVAAPPKPAVPEAARSAPSVSIPQAARIYSTADLDVKPPTGIDQPLPRWTPSAMFASQTLNGVLEVVVNEKGLVESAGLLQGTGTPYDAQLVAAARGWHFRPAVRGGIPVKYRKSVGFVLQPQAAAQRGAPKPDQE